MVKNSIFFHNLYLFLMIFFDILLREYEWMKFSNKNHRSERLQKIIQHHVKLLCRRKLGHSRKINVKLLGSKMQENLHPYQKECRFILMFWS